MVERFQTKTRKLFLKSLMKAISIQFVLNKAVGNSIRYSNKINQDFGLTFAIMATEKMSNIILKLLSKTHAKSQLSTNPAYTNKKISLK